MNFSWDFGTERENLERFVNGNLQEHATCLHSFLERSEYMQNSELFGIKLPETIALLKEHQKYATFRLSWYEEWNAAGISGEDFSEYDLPSNREMNKISNAAYKRKMKEKAINELIDKLNVIPTTWRSWCVSVRKNDFDNFRSCGALVGNMLYYANHEGNGWFQRKVIPNPDWDSYDHCDFHSTIKKRLGKESVSVETPIAAMLMVCVKSAMKSRSQS